MYYSKLYLFFDLKVTFLMMDYHHQSPFLNRLPSENKYIEGISRTIPKTFQSYLWLATTPYTSQFQPVSRFILTAVGMSQHSTGWAPCKHKQKTFPSLKELGGEAEEVA